MEADRVEVTILLAKLTKGNKEAGPKLVPLVYSERGPADGCLHVAEDTWLCRIVALKSLPEEVASDPQIFEYLITR